MVGEEEEKDEKSLRSGKEEQRGTLQFKVKQHGAMSNVSENHSL